MSRKKGSPAQERAVCPKCGGKTLGNTYFSRFEAGDPFAYRQCRNPTCGHTAKIPGDVPPPAANKPDFPANKRERAVFENYVNGCTSGTLYAFVQQGMAGEPAPPRSDSIQYAAWMAGKELANA